MGQVKQVKKRDGRVVDFDVAKITDAIFRAARAVGGTNRAEAGRMGGKVAEEVEKLYDGHSVPGIEDVQDIVEKILIQNGHARTAKAYILYREERRKLRDAKDALGVMDDLKLPYNSIKVLERRYLRKDALGKVIETPKGMFRRVAANVASADLLYGQDADVAEEKFFDIMTKLEFTPNSPTLMNAGTDFQQLSACFVLPVPDSLEGIFESVKHAALIHQTGGGTGFSFTRLRPKGDIVRSCGGTASGPVSFMKVFDGATGAIKQGGRRRGANMGMLRVDHPDVLDFVTCKEDLTQITNFNISVLVTEKFMEAVIKGEDYDLLNPRTHEPVRKMNARQVFENIVLQAWKTGEPGLVFIDRVNADNTTIKVTGEMEATNPCGEQPLLPYESCNLGSINLARFVTPAGDINWTRLREVVHTSIHFLDNIIDMNKYVIPQIEQITRFGNRKIGLGVMGWADMLFALRIPYNSLEAIQLADQLMNFIKIESIAGSAELAKVRGNFANYEGSMWSDRSSQYYTPYMRNATVNTIAPTGTISIIAGCSGGVEPLFAVAFLRNVMDNTELLEVNPYFEKMAKDEGWFSEELMREIVKHGTVAHIDGVPQQAKNIFVTSHDLKPEDHIRMQAIWQKHTIGNAVSKTINFPTEASPKEIEEAYILAYKLGCKGVTVYRDKSRANQAMNVGQVSKQAVKVAEPEKGQLMVQEAPVNRDAIMASKVTRTADGLKVAADYAGGCETCSV